LEGDQIDSIIEGNSFGMRKGVDNLLVAIKVRASDPVNADFLYPEVELRSENYKHSSGNVIHNPVFKVIAWRSLNGEVQEEQEKLEEKTAVKKKKARRRS